MTRIVSQAAPRSTGVLARAAVAILALGLFPAAWAALPAPRGAVVRSAHGKPGAASPSIRRMIRMAETARALPRAASSPERSRSVLETWDRLRLYRARRAAGRKATEGQAAIERLTRARGRQHRTPNADRAPGLIRWQRLDRWQGFHQLTSR